MSSSIKPFTFCNKRFKKGDLYCIMEPCQNQYRMLHYEDYWHDTDIVFCGVLKAHGRDTESYTRACPTCKQGYLVLNGIIW